MVGLPKQTGNAHFVHVPCSGALQKLWFESLSSSAHRSSEIVIFGHNRLSSAGPRDRTSRTWCFAHALMRFLWRKEDTRGARLRDEILEPLFDAQVSNTRTAGKKPRPHASLEVASLEVAEMLLALVHFFCCPAGGLRIRVQLSPSVAEQRRWSFGQRAEDFSIPLVCRNSRRSASMFVTRASDKTFGMFHVDRRSRLVV